MLPDGQKPVFAYSAARMYYVGRAGRRHAPFHRMLGYRVCFCSVLACTRSWLHFSLLHSLGDRPLFEWLVWYATVHDILLPAAPFHLGGGDTQLNTVSSHSGCIQRGRCLHPPPLRLFRFPGLSFLSTWRGTKTGPTPRRRGVGIHRSGRGSSDRG